MSLLQTYPIILAAFALAAVFGAAAHRARFCTVGAISDWLHFGDTARLRAWLLGIGVAITGVQLLGLLTPIGLRDSVYLAPQLAWLGHLAGGLLFGIGMTLASGCAQRNLVLAGGGNLKSFVVLAALALAAYGTIGGVLAPLRDAADAASLDLAAYGLADQSLAGIVARAAGFAGTAGFEAVLALGAGVALTGWAFASRGFRRRPEQVMLGLCLGLIVVAGWYLTGVVGAAHAVRPDSFNFVVPFAPSSESAASSLARPAGFGIAAVLGLLGGSFAYAFASGRLRLERFASRADLLAHAAGGALMGFGGALALGCTIGQGVTGVSTLALGSLMTLAAIVLGAVVTMKVQYHRLDDVGFARALARALAELRPRRRRAGAV